MEGRFNIKSEEKIFKVIHIIMLALFLLIATYTVFTSKEKQFNLVIYSILFLILTTLRHFYLGERKNKILYFIFPYIEGILLYLISTINNTGLSLIMIMLMDIALDYKNIYVIIYGIIGYFTYMFIYIRPYPDYPLITKIMLFTIALVQFTLFTGFAFLTRVYSSQSKKLRKTTAELNAKMIDLEEMTLFKERSRIAGEIHNTVGHQLTTALIQIEATQMVMDKDIEEGKKRLLIIKEQVKKGLNEIRKSISAINADYEYENFKEAIDRLLSQVRNHGKIDIDCKIDDINEGEINLKKTLYHVILEAITNGIKHGNCNKVSIVLIKKEGIINLSIFNNGTLPENLNYGYGLSHMKEKIKELGGTLSVKINDKGWFGLIVTLPIYYREGDNIEEN